MGLPQYLDGLFHGTSEIKMDDDWGYPYSRKPPHARSYSSKANQSSPN